ncbi:MAG: hypothetical protein JNJ61_08975 [Anaerolineae bacterium]|nr:hypothetical protein [Anaerolineae bacterium]
MGRRRRSDRRDYRDRDYYDDRDDYRDDNRSRRRTRGKSRDEERIERMTWFALVIIFAALQILPEGGLTLPNWFVPLSGSIVLLASGAVQYSRGWRVSPITWLAGAMLAALSFINLNISPERNFLGISMIVFAGVILMGLITGET